MALIKNIKHLKLEKLVNHSDAECTFDVLEERGQKFLQLDTYGSSDRQFQGKKSQSIRFTPEALLVLKQIIQNNGL